MKIPTFLEFVQERLGAPLSPYQKELIDRLESGDKLVVNLNARQINRERFKSICASYMNNIDPHGWVTTGWQFKAAPQEPLDMPLLGDHTD